jgi:hypothetical protein
MNTMVWSHAGDLLKEILLQNIKHGFKLAEDERSMLVDNKFPSLSSRGHTNTTVQQQLPVTQTW